MNRPFVLMYRTLDTEDAVNYHAITLRYCLILTILLIEKLVNFRITRYRYARAEKLSLCL